MSRQFFIIPITKVTVEIKINSNYFNLALKCFEHTNDVQTNYNFTNGAVNFTVSIKLQMYIRTHIHIFRSRYADSEFYEQTSTYCVHVKQARV